MKKAVILGIVAVTLSINAHAGVHFTQDSQGNTTSLSGLYSDEQCSPWPLTGTVVKRDFEGDGVTLKGLVVENSDGTRKYINASVPTELGFVSRGAVYNGLQRLTKIGRHVRGQVLLCGSAPFMYLESIR